MPPHSLAVGLDGRRADQQVPARYTLRVLGKRKLIHAESTRTPTSPTPSPLLLTSPSRGAEAGADHRYPQGAGMGARGPRRTPRARPSFPDLVDFGETRSCEPRAPRCRTLGHRPCQRDAPRRCRRLVGRPHRPGSLPALRRRAPTEARSGTATGLVRRAPSAAARPIGSGLRRLRFLARWPASPGDGVRVALRLTSASGPCPYPVTGADTPSFAKRRVRVPKGRQRADLR